jgi:hypothetical protein
MRRAIFSPSMAQGPHRRKKLLLLVCFSWGIRSRFIDPDFGAKIREFECYSYFVKLFNISKIRKIGLL